jgi:hypothetical protein
MNEWDAINCRIDCGRCNHKGKPSVSKGSKTCLINRKMIPETNEDAFSFKMFFKQLIARKGLMRASGKNEVKEYE